MTDARTAALFNIVRYNIEEGYVEAKVMPEGCKEIGLCDTEMQRIVATAQVAGARFMSGGM